MVFQVSREKGNSQRIETNVITCRNVLKTEIRRYTDDIWVAVNGNVCITESVVINGTMEGGVIAEEVN